MDKSKNNIKVFIGLAEIAGYCNNLKKGFDQLGVTNVFINLEANPFKYGNGDKPNWIVKSLTYFLEKNRNTSRVKLLRKIFLIFSINILKCFLFVWALINYDVFIFLFNTTFFNYHELKILKLFNKRIIYVYLGSDSRPPYINGALITSADIADVIYKNDMIESCKINFGNCKKLTDTIKDKIIKIERYADIIIDYPAQGLFHEKSFILGFAVGLPCKLDISIASVKPLNRKENKKRSIKILHCPSRPASKGTMFIRKTINNLKDKGYDIEYIELINKPNSAVIEEIQSCDFVIDELYSDTPMGVLGVEAAYFGKPAVVGGYYKGYILDDIPEEFIPPGCYCYPDDIEKVVEELILDESMRLEMGRKAQRFVSDYLSSEKVAERYLKLISGEIPKQWIFEPQNIRYIYGYGLSKDVLKDILKQIIDEGGIETLNLKDKPALEKMFYEFVEHE